MTTRHVWARRVVRLGALAAAAALAGGWFGARGALILPALSPFAGPVAALALRHAAPWLLVALPVTLLAWRRGRWFCRHACPTGILIGAVSRGRPAAARRAGRIPRLAHWLVVLAFGGALAGLPLFLQADPLVLFNGFFGALRRPMVWMNLLPGAGLVAVLLFCAVFPYAWCGRLCPLGAVQDGVFQLRTTRAKWRAAQRAARASSEGVAPPAARTRAGEKRFRRRHVLGAAAGGLAALALRRLYAAPAHVLRPPGAAPEQDFQALCARCGNCMNVCPERIIEPDLGKAGVGGLLAARLRIGPGYCSEWCAACGAVCPTGAIRALPLERKQCVSIGTAVVDRERCLAWNNAEYCMVCDEYCPYHAIRAVSHGGVNCPDVDPEICRGCGLCQTVCPALRVAITVQPRAQRALAPVPL
jgi:Pyruvate/2-oxoacid:ferredoxin oxidoreductase delta subunit